MTRLARVNAIIQAALRLLCLCAGACVAVVVPTAHAADARRALNAATGHLPDMDPGIGVFQSRLRWPQQGYSSPPASRMISCVASSIWSSGSGSSPS